MKTFQPSRKTNEYQLRQMICGIAGAKVSDAEAETTSELLRHLECIGRLSLPFDTDNISFIPDKLPVLAQISQKSSALRNILEDQPETTILIQDGIIGGRPGLLCVQLTSQPDCKDNWVRKLVTPNCIINAIDPARYIISSPLSAFAIKD